MTLGIKMNKLILKQNMIWLICWFVIVSSAIGLKPESHDNDMELLITTISDNSTANETLWNITATTTAALTTPESVACDPNAGEKPANAPLPSKGEAAKEKAYSLTIFFILLVVAVCILVVHLLIQTNFRYLPESVAVVLIGAFLGLILKVLAYYDIANWQTEESFPPTMFFLVLLPPIIFESGFNLHKGNFFQNFGTILLFAVVGTTLSAFVFGAGIYLLGLADVVYKLSFVESFAFGSLISAVDPVATLAIFHAIDVDPVLYMLVFGESVLNDAVAIVLATTFVQMASPSMAGVSGGMVFLTGVARFVVMFLASAAIGVGCGLISALFIDLRKTPSLEFGMMLIFSYAPYGLAEGLHLSGIMAVLFCGVVMSHYTHANLSPVAQITTQLTFRTIAFIAETCMFAYLGLAIFSFKHIVKPALVIWAIVMLLLSRAANICPLSFVANYFREHKITPKMQFVMWFSGMRGAVSFALSLHLEISKEPHHVVVTTTLIIVLFTILFLGGSTMPMMKILNRKKPKSKSKREISLSKTKEMGTTVDSEHYSEMTEEENEVHFMKPHLKGFAKLDMKYLTPFFTRRFTQQEVKEGRMYLTTLTNQWYQEVRAETESEEEEENVAPP